MDTLLLEGGTLTNTKPLPREIVFDILVRLSAQDIYYTARLVCGEWYRMIHTHDFIHEHLNRSPKGLLIGDPSDNIVKFVSMKPGGPMEMSDINYKFPYECIAPSFNGLMVTSDEECDGQVLCVLNPVTKQRLRLPQLVSESEEDRSFWSRPCIAYAAGSMKYKVVLAHSVAVQMIRIAILTVGVDNSWRHVSMDHLSPSSREILLRQAFPDEGFVHIYGHCFPGSNVLLTLNVETESLTETLLPPGYEEKILDFVSTGCSLTFAHRCGKHAWEVWELKSGAGEWKILAIVDLKPQICGLGQLFGKRNINLGPIGWLNTKEAIVFGEKFRPSPGEPNVIVSYNVCTRKIESLNIGITPLYRGRQHVNSLVCIDRQV